MKQILLATIFFVLPALASESNLTSTDPYEVLGVSPYVDEHALTEAWIVLIKRHHPDSGGNDIDAQNVNEAYQFLRKNRAEYDRRLLPFRDAYKAVESRALVVVDGPRGEDEYRYRALYRDWLDQEPRAKDLASRYDGGSVFIFYGIMDLSSTPADFQQFTRWQVEAYVDLINHLDLFTLTKAEFTWITLHNPAEALNGLLEHYDNFTVRYSTITDLMRALRIFHLENDKTSMEFLLLIEKMAANGLLFDLRYKAFHKEIAATLKAWTAIYLDKSRAERRPFHEQYDRTKAMLKRVETFPNYINTCARLLFGLKPSD